MAATELLGRSFSDALYERYCDFDSTFDDLKNGCDVVFFVGCSPKKTDAGLVLNASTVVLTDERISHVGDPRAVATSCSHVELVDISSNALSDWHEISLLLSSLPHVKTINLSFNPFPSHLHILPDEIQWPNLNTLCLNGSHISLEMIVEVLKKTPNLEELQICSNNYTSIPPTGDFVHERLKRVYISKNKFSDWQSICRLGRLFPQIATLIASDNPFQSFRSDDDDVQASLANLHTLSVDQVQISDWSDILALTQLPSLHALRIHSAPLLKSYHKDERFFLILGYMQSLTKLNGSDITATERETSERRFIRYYSPRDDKPARYFQLIEKHGQLKPLADITMRAPYLTQVHLVYNQTTYEKVIDVRQTVRQFKKYLQDTFHVPSNRLRVFYVDDVAFSMGVCGPEELKYPQRLLHTYKIHDGDQFHIDLKPDVRKPTHAHQKADCTRRTRKKSVDTSPNSSFSSSSSEDDKTGSPFSFESLQKLSNQTDTDRQLAFSQLDQLYPSAANPPQINDDDDDLLFAAAAACSHVQRN